MIPVTPGLTLKVVVLIDETFIASLKVAVMTAREHTPVAPVRGVAEITTGGGSHALAAVVKLHKNYALDQFQRHFWLAC